MCRVGFIILHYGDVAVTQRCIHSIMTMDDADQVQIVVVDNDPNINDAMMTSADGRKSDKWSRYASQDDIHIVATGNVGFSAANNIAYRWIRENLDVNILIACNNDIVFTQRDFLARLREYLISQATYNCQQRDGSNDDNITNQPLAVIGPDVVDYDSHRHQNPLDTRIRTKSEARRTYVLNRIGLALFPLLYLLLDRQMRQMEQNVGHEEPLAGEMENVVLVGACLIFTEHFIRNEQALFTPETQFYYEEYLLARRCEHNHYRMCYVPELQVLHHSGTATKGANTNRREQVRKRMQRTADACKIYMDSE